MIAEIVTIGTELLLGEIVDSNAAYIARQLAAIGVDHYYTTTVGDNEERIVQTLRTALERSDVVITSGGLGPTPDDLTRQAVARATDRELVFVPELYAEIEARFKRRGTSTITPNNRAQAFVPAGSIIVHNPVGSAPCFIVETNGKAIMSLPGVPHEMRHILHERLLPYISEKMGHGAVILSRFVHVGGIGESAAAQLITDLMYSTNPTVGTRAHPGITDICITAKGETIAEATILLDEMEAKVRERLGSSVYGSDKDTLGGVVAAGLKAKGMRIAIGETFTGGQIARALADGTQGDSVLAGMEVSLDAVTLARDLGLELSDVNAESAGTIAKALREHYRAAAGLAVFEGSGPEPMLYTVLSTADGTQIDERTPRHDQDYGVPWTVNTAMNMVRLWLEGQRAD